MLEQRRAPELRLVAANDGTALACWDFGGEGPPLLIAHGTSLHGRCWGPVAARLPVGSRTLAIDLRGHGRSGLSPDGAYPWDRFAQDILSVVDQLGLSGTGLSGAGHSCGAASLLLAEAARPGTFDRLWLWEPIMTLPGSDLRRGRSEELAERARRRRSHWPSMADAREYLENRGMFAEVKDEAFEAFLSGAFCQGVDGGLELACPPEVEALVYEAAPGHNAWGQLPHISSPVRLLGGESSAAVPPGDIAAIAGRLTCCDRDVWPGYGHFGPFQDPEAVAADIADWTGKSAPQPTS